MSHRIQNLTEMQELAGTLLQKIRKPALVLLEGDLGAGKTTFVKQMCARLGFPEKQIKSPTFSLINVYRLNESTINHLDLYRLESPDRFILEELRELLQSGEITFVEWGERLGDLSQIANGVHFYIIKIQRFQDEVRLIDFEDGHNM